MDLEISFTMQNLVQIILFNLSHHPHILVHWTDSKTRECILQLLRFEPSLVGWFFVA